jgi:hypothetical protein
MNGPGLVESLSIDLTDPVDPIVDAVPTVTRATRAELVHRHLVARLQAARAELHELGAQVGAPDELVSWLGTVVAERRDQVELARAERHLRADAVLAAADEEAAGLVAAAEVEARVLRAVALWLEAEPLARAAFRVPVDRDEGDRTQP